jgi:serine/threonine protein kinase
MPLREGNLTSLAKTHDDHDALCTAVLEQMLSSLDYLASNNMVHRDIKPDNILYSHLGNKEYLFQLADFGLANHYSLAKTMCGTAYYQAPELWPTFSKVIADQSPKMDIWSLIATTFAVHPKYAFPPRGARDYGDVLRAVRNAVLKCPGLEAMARMHPDHRASAAQLLVVLFSGNGLTTPRSQVLPIEPDVKEPTKPTAAGPSHIPQTGTGHAPRNNLIVFPPRWAPQPQRRTNTPTLRNQLGKQPAGLQAQPIRMHRGRVTKRRAEPIDAKAIAFGTPQRR